jgi:hypothetical protein
MVGAHQVQKLGLTGCQVDKVGLTCVSQGCQARGFFTFAPRHGWALHVRLGLTRGQIHYTHGFKDNAQI